MVHPYLKPPDEQREMVRQIARHLSPNIKQLLHDWIKAYQEMDPTVDQAALYEMERMYWAFFMMWLEDVDINLFQGRMAAAARRLCRMQVSFDHLALSFHLMEDCCLPFIKQIYPEKEKLVEAMVAMDSMCHACFSTIASSYFKEKYTGTVPRPPAEKHATQLDQAYKLTPRESEVLKQIVDGYRNREIAKMLRISVKTVEHHRANLMRKLKTHNMADLIKFAIWNSLA